jgi:cytosine/adenosine deaminase-related metal-dependent hydrolase
MHAAHDRVRDLIDAHDAFRLATRAAARSGLMADDLGEIAPAVGRSGVARPHTLGLSPLHDPVAQLAYSVSSEGVRTVIVDGAVIMQDRKLAPSTRAQSASGLRKPPKNGAATSSRRPWPRRTGCFR